MKTICLDSMLSFSGEALERVCSILGVSSACRIFVRDNKDILPKLIAENHALAISAMHTMAKGRVEVPFASLVGLLDDSHGIQIPLAIRMPVEFFLLCNQGVILEEVEGVVAHEEALGACSGIVSRFPKFKSIPSNSKAARMVANGGRYAKWAVLASRKCAEAFHLKVVGERVSNAPAVTTFYGFTKGITAPKLKSDTWRLLAVFDLLHKPKSLSGVLNQIDHNILHLHSIHQSGGKYRFVIEVEIPTEEIALMCADRIRLHTMKVLTFVFPVLEW